MTHLRPMLNSIRKRASHRAVTWGRALAACWLIVVLAGCEVQQPQPITAKNSPPAAANKPIPPSVDAIDAKTPAAPPAVKSEQPETPSASTEDMPDANDDTLRDDARKFDIPANATNEQLLAFIDDVQGRMYEDKERGALAIVGATDRVLKNDPTSDERRIAIREMLHWTERLHAIYAQEARATHLYWKLRLADFAAEEDPKTALLVQRSQLINEAHDWSHLPEELQASYPEKLGDYLAKRPLDDADLDFASIVAEAVLTSGDRMAAIRVDRTLAEILVQSPNEDAVQEGQRLTGMAHRLESFGQTIALSGTLLDGEPLDWASYNGRVVLVDFWATWCGPCIREIPNIKRLYEEYHERGFDVIAVSLDKDADVVKEFVKNNDIPWPIMFSSDPDAAGMRNPLAVEFAVTSIPVALVIDQRGHLVSLEARGRELERLLAQLIGPAAPPVESNPASQSDEKSDTEKKLTP